MPSEKETVEEKRKRKKKKNSRKLKRKYEVEIENKNRAGQDGLINRHWVLKYRRNNCEEEEKAG